MALLEKFATSCIKVLYKEISTAFEKRITQKVRSILLDRDEHPFPFERSSEVNF